MATIPRQWLEAYTESMAGASARIQRQAAKSLAKVDFANKRTAYTELVTIFEYYLPSAMDIGGELAATFYDSCRELCTGEAMGAEVETGYNAEADEVAIKGILANHDDADVVIRQALDRIDAQMKRAAYNTTMRNIKADKKHPRFARVPGFSKTYGNGCPFCTMLASRGFVYYSSAAAGEGDHWHAKCTCKVVPMWGDGSIEGYDYSEYEKAYNSMSSEQKKAMSDAGTESRNANRSTTQSWARQRYRGNRLGIYGDTDS